MAKFLGVRPLLTVRQKIKSDKILVGKSASYCLALEGVITATDTAQTWSFRYVIPSEHDVSLGLSMCEATIVSMSVVHYKIITAWFRYEFDLYFRTGVISNITSYSIKSSLEVK